jgi:hypothetical protein
MDYHLMMVMIIPNISLKWTIKVIILFLYKSLLILVDGDLVGVFYANPNEMVRETYDIDY